MRKHFIYIAFLFLIPCALKAQKSGLRLNIGIPLGAYGKFDHTVTGSDKTNSPSFIIQMEKEWKENISIGAYIGYVGQKHEFNDGFSKIKYNYYRVGTLLTYELNSWLSEMNLSPGNGIEMYASAKTGFSLEYKKSSFSNLDSSNNQYIRKSTQDELLFDLGILLGTRYHFTDQFGVFSELGWGNAGFFTLGATFKL